MADRLRPVPTVEDLARRGLARADAGTGRWVIFPAGETELREAMAHNARVLRADAGLRCEVESAGIRAARVG